MIILPVGLAATALDAQENVAPCGAKAFLQSWWHCGSDFASSCCVWPIAMHLLNTLYQILVENIQKHYHSATKSDGFQVRC
jgi:hypothetical protein